jgi:hypothetical protein
MFQIASVTISTYRYFYRNCSADKSNESTKFCVKLEKISTDAYAMFSEACGGRSFEKSSVFEWHKRFKKGCEWVEDDERSG